MKVIFILLVSTLMSWSVMAIGPIKFIQTSFLKGKCAYDKQGCIEEISEALTFHDLETIESYLQGGISPDELFSRWNGMTNETLTEVAARVGNQKAVELFIEYGATITDKVFFYGIRSKDISVVKKYFLNDKLRQNRKVGFDEINSHVINLHVQAVQFLIDQGVEIHPINHKYESTLISLAGAPKNQKGNYLQKVKDQLTIATVLLENGADVNYLEKRLPHVRYAPGLLSAMTPLTAAMKLNDYVYAKWIIENGADVNLMNESGETPLTIAVQGDFMYSLKYVKLLIDNGADVNLENGHRQTPLMLADSPYRKEVAQLLVNSGAKIPEEVNED